MNKEKSEKERRGGELGEQKELYSGSLLSKVVTHFACIIFFNIAAK